jgi:hypothetical protein
MLVVINIGLSRTYTNYFSYSFWNKKRSTVIETQEYKQYISKALQRTPAGKAGGMQVESR